MSEMTEDRWAEAALADRLGVDRSVLRRWRKAHPTGGWQVGFRKRIEYPVEVVERLSRDLGLNGSTPELTQHDGTVWRLPPNQKLCYVELDDGRRVTCRMQAGKVRVSMRVTVQPTTRNPDLWDLVRVHRRGEKR